MSDYKKLGVWRKGHALVLNVDRVAGRIRGRAALRNQMTRAAASISTNIVEGRGKKSDADFARFIGYAIHSSSELEYHLLTAHDLGVLNESDFRTLTRDTIEVRKMLHGLLNSLTKRKDEGESTETDPS